eukprot:TRINITY_DN3462_c0_g1_i1.p1 TRINITY_DN3462_c0_g1~~TRINITY_DN3462_c0_g1_i1.p1  ORF type:complete len:569 (-),score=98.50 TRINITY_DN3462_c0_g1_i1:119-1825(-)
MFLRRLRPLVRSSLCHLSVCHKVQRQLWHISTPLPQFRGFAKKSKGSKGSSAQQAELLRLANQHLADGQAWAERGHYSQAEASFQECLQLRQQVYSEEHDALLEVLNELGRLHTQHLQFEAAIQCLERAVHIAQRVHGTAHQEHQVPSLVLLAHAHRVARNYQAALPLLQQATEVTQRVFGSRHPHLAHRYDDMALLAHSQGEATEAVIWLQKALDLRLELYGAPSWLAELQQRLEWDSDVVLWQVPDDLSACEAEEVHPELGSSFLHLGMVAYYQRDWPRALSYLLASQRVHHSQQPPIAQYRAHAALVDCYSAQRRMDEALEVALYSVKMAQQQGDAYVEEQVRALLRYGDVCVQAGLADESYHSLAHQTLESTLQLARTHLGPFTQLSVDAATALARFYLQRRGHAKARDLLLTTLHELTQALPQPTASAPDSATASSPASFEALHVNVAQLASKFKQMRGQPLMSASVPLSQFFFLPAQENYARSVELLLGELLASLGQAYAGLNDIEAATRHLNQAHQLYAAHLHPRDSRLLQLERQILTLPASHRLNPPGFSVIDPNPAPNN